MKSEDLALAIIGLGAILALGVEASKATGTPAAPGGQPPAAPGGQPPPASGTGTPPPPSGDNAAILAAYRNNPQAYGVHQDSPLWRP